MAVKDPFNVARNLGSTTKDPLMPFGQIKSPDIPKFLIPTEDQIKEQEALAKAAELESISSKVSAAIMNNPEWAGASLEGQKEYLEAWDIQRWSSYAEAKYGPDWASSIEALQEKRAILAPLQEQINARQAEVDASSYGIGNFESNADRLATRIIAGMPYTAQNAQLKSVDRVLARMQERRDELLSASTIDEQALKKIEHDINYYVERQIAEQQLLDNRAEVLRYIQQDNAKRDVERRQTNAAYDEVLLRRQELTEEVGGLGAPFLQIYEGGLIEGGGLLLSEVFGQLPNFAGAVAGGIVAGAPGAALGGGLTVFNSILEENASEINTAPAEVLLATPEGKRLAAMGLSEDEIRNQMVSTANTELLPYATAWGMLSGLVGPELILSKALPTNVLIRGLAKNRLGRFALAGLAGPVGEGFQEAGEEVWGNYGWNVATGDNRSLLENTGAAFGMGALIGLPGAVVNIRQNTRDLKARVTDKQTPEGMTEAGGFNAVAPGAQLASEGGTAQAVTTAADTQNMHRATTQFMNANQQLTDMINNKVQPDFNTLHPIMQALDEALELGLNPEAVERVLSRATMQMQRYMPLGTGFNLNDALEAYRGTKEPTVTGPTYDTTAPLSQQLDELRTAITDLDTQAATINNAPLTPPDNLVTVRQQPNGSTIVSTPRGDRIVLPGEDVDTVATAAREEANRTWLEDEAVRRTEQVDNITEMRAQVEGVVTQLEQVVAQQAAAGAAGLSPSFVQQDAEGNLVIRQAVRDNQVNQIRRFEIEQQNLEPGNAFVDPNTVPVENLADLQPENIVVSAELPATATDAEVFNYTTDILQRAGMNSTDAGFASVMFMRLLDTLVQMTGQNRAYHMRRINFSPATDLSELLNTAVANNAVNNPDNISDAVRSIMATLGAFDPDSVATGQPVPVQQPRRRKAPAKGRPVNGVVTSMPTGPVAAIPQAALRAQLPAKLRGAKPRYRQARLTFATDMDRAAYIIANRRSESKSHEAYMDFLKRITGWDTETIYAYGAYVRSQLKPLYEHGVTTTVAAPSLYRSDWYTTKLDNGLEVSDYLAGLSTEEFKEFMDQLIAVGYFSENEIDMIQAGQGTYDGTITDPTKRAVMEAVYTHQGRGRVDFTQSGTHRLIFGKGNSVGDVVNLFERYFISEAIRLINDPTIQRTPQMMQLEQDIQELAQLGNINEPFNRDAWTNTHLDHIGQLFEKYLYDGNSAPTLEMGRIFQRMTELLKKIYQNVRDFLRLDVSPEVKAIFDRQMDGYVEEGIHEAAENTVRDFKSNLPGDLLDPEYVDSLMRIRSQAQHMGLNPDETYNKIVNELMSLGLSEEEAVANGYIMVQLMDSMAELTGESRYDQLRDLFFTSKEGYLHSPMASERAINTEEDVRKWEAEGRKDPIAPFRAFIRVFVNDDPSSGFFRNPTSFAHEAMHWFTDKLLRVFQENAPARSARFYELREQFIKIAESYGIPRAEAFSAKAWEAWSTPYSERPTERASVDFQNYLMYGTASNPEIDSVFSKIRSTLSNLWESWRDFRSSIGASRDPNQTAVDQAVVDFFDSILGDNSELIRQTSRGPAGGPDSRGVADSGRPEAIAGTTGTSPVATSDAAPGGADATTTGGGVSGTPRADAGTVTADVQSNQQVWGQAGDGTVSGPDNQPDALTSQEPDSGQRIGVGETEQRPGDVGRPEATGVTPLSQLDTEAEHAQLTQNFERALPLTSQSERGLLARASAAARYATAMLEAARAGQELVYEDYRATQDAEHDMVATDIADTLINETGSIATAELDEMVSNPDEAHTMDAQMISSAEQEDIVLRGAMPPEITSITSGFVNSPFDGEHDFDGYEPDVVEIPVREPTAQEEAAQKRAIVDEMDSILINTGVKFDGTPVQNADNTAGDVLYAAPVPEELQAAEQQAVSTLRQQAHNLSAAQCAGQINVEQRARAFMARVGGSARQIGRMAQAVTAVSVRALRGDMAALGTWLNHVLPTMAGNFDTMAQTLYMVTSRINAARTMLEDMILVPLNDLFTNIAEAMGKDPAEIKRKIGLAYTLLHTMEGEPIYHARLLEAVQNAIASGDQRAYDDAVQALAEYERYQRMPDAAVIDSYGNGATQERVRCFGGRPVWECQLLLQEITEYFAGHENLLEDGITAMQNSINSVTNTAASNGLINSSYIESFKDYEYYAPLYTEARYKSGAENDLDIVMPNQEHYRNGSTDPSMTADQTLQTYIIRTAMAMGDQDFAIMMDLAYNNGGAEMGLERIDYAEEMRKINQVSTYDFKGAEGMRKVLDDRVDAILRVPTIEVDPETGEQRTVIKVWGYGFDINKNPTEKKGLRAPFKQSKLSPAMGAMATATRFRGKTMTGYRLLFPVRNCGNDSIERITLLMTKRYYAADGTIVSGVKVAGKMARILANPHVWAKLASFKANGRTDGSKLGQMFDEYRQSGARYNYNHLLAADESSEGVVNAMAGIANKISLGGLNTVRNFFHGWSDYWYDMPGFAQFYAMKELGIGTKDAAAGVRGLMNMQQTGTWTGPMQTFYPFVNSIMQTSGQIFGALGIHSGWSTGNKNMISNSIRGWATMVGLIIVAHALIPPLREAWGKDENGIYRMDLMPIGSLITHLPIPLENGGVFKVPTGFGLSALAMTFAYTGDRVSRGVMSPEDANWTVLTQFTKNLVPNSAPAFQFSDDPLAFIAQTIAPTWAAPTVEVLTNRNYFGGKITWAEASSDKRKSDSGHFRTPDIWKRGARWLYQTTGLDVAPEELRTIVSGYSSGFLQGIPALMEKNDFTKAEGFESSRQILGPLWTTLGASVLYSPEVNQTSSAFYDMLEHYNGRIKQAGIQKLLTSHGISGKNSSDKIDAYKTAILQAAGWTNAEITDYLNIQRTQNKINSMSREYKPLLDAIYGPNMDQDAAKNIMSAFAERRAALMKSVIQNSFYWESGYKRRWGVPDPGATEAMRQTLGF